MIYDWREKILERVHVALPELVPGKAAWGHIPQGTSGLRVRLWNVGGTDGFTTQGTGMIDRRVQIDVFADHDFECYPAADRLAEYLSAYRDPDYAIWLFLDVERDLSSTESGEVLYRVSQDYRVAFRRDTL